MEAYLYLQALILGIVEGLTEFLPVSSTGHLIITSDLMGFVGDRAKTFQIFIQLGAIAGVAWYYRARLIDVACGLSKPPARRFALNLLVAFLPAVVFGLLFHQQIRAYLFSPVTVAVALIAGGAAILIIERLPLRARVATIDAISPLDALKVGLAQTCALFPGVSRAGATIMGGLLTGFTRTVATEFSFFLAMPTMAAATLYDLYKSRDFLTADDIALFSVGFISAFITAMIVVKVFLSYVARHDFTVFAYYRIGFGIVVLWYFL